MSTVCLGWLNAHLGSPDLGSYPLYLMLVVASPHGHRDNHRRRADAVQSAAPGAALAEARDLCPRMGQIARAIDPQLRGSWPRHAQFYRWLRGALRELPYPDACRVLELMFPRHSLRDLFRPCSPETVNELAINSEPPTGSLPPGLDPLSRTGIYPLWPRTDPDALHDLVSRVSGAHDEISIFGLTRNLYASDGLLPLIESKACEIPVTFYVMDPHCGSRRDRYRLEPVQGVSCPAAARSRSCT
jgi:hypothetical protein